MTTYIDQLDAAHKALGLRGTVIGYWASGEYRVRLPDGTTAKRFRPQSLIDALATQPHHETDREQS